MSVFSGCLIICFLLNLILGASSSEFHSISSTSESPQKQEELKKQKQKTKIVKRKKRRGENKIKRRVRLIPTTGHGKELIGKAHGRKGEQEAQFELISVVNMFSEFSYIMSSVKKCAFGVKHLRLLESAG